MTITDGAGKSVAVQFSEGQKIASWPTGLPVAAGARYWSRGGRWRQPHRALDRAGAGGLEGLAQSFIRNDCQAQLDVLIDTFASPSAS